MDSPRKENVKARTKSNFLFPFLLGYAAAKAMDYVFDQKLPFLIN
jgi:hypothetical protein